MIPNNLAQHLLDRRLAYVKRWHQKPDQGFPESMAEHSGWVARLSLYLALSYEIGREVGMDGIDWRRLLAVAVCHDDAEQLTGDMPGSFKKLVPEAAEQLHQWEASMLPLLYGGMGSVTNFLHAETRAYVLSETRKPPPLEHEVVKLADRTTALAYANSQVLMGNELFLDILRDVADEVLEKVSAYWDRWLRFADSENTIGKAAAAIRAGLPRFNHPGLLTT